jgi:DNA (cytosine-5)-methyltransferase 1
LNVLDLFSGIGGFSLGLERAGMRTVAFCEIEPFCRAVLKKHWPDVPVFGDIRELTAEALADAIGVWELQSEGRESDERGRIGYCGIDVICGGFPCQDISIAGKGAGIEGERSGLWSEYARIIGEVRPRYVIVENVAALLHRGIERVLGDLATLGYDAEWHCIPACAVGAPHRRDRIWIVADPKQQRLERRAGCGLSRSWGASIELACGNWWFSEPDVGRVAHGVPARVDRLRSLGNAVVPQIPEIIGRAIMAQHQVTESGADPAKALS